MVHLTFFRTVTLALVLLLGFAIVQAVQISSLAREVHSFGGEVAVLAAELPE